MMKLKRLIASVTAAAMIAAMGTVTANAANSDDFFENTYSYITISNDNYTATIKELAITQPCTITLNFACYNSEQQAGGVIPMPFSLDYEILLDTDTSNWIDNATPAYSSDSGDFETVTYTVTAEQINNAGGGFKLYCGVRAKIYPNNIDDLEQKYHLSVKAELTDNDPYNQIVSGTFQPANAPDTVYNVDISWGDMAFTYHEAKTGTWQPQNHTYLGAQDANWTADSVDGDVITVSNRSNAAIKAGFAFTAADGYSVGADFTKNGTALTDNSITLDSAAVTGTLQSQSVTVSPTGSITEGEGVTLGTVTITITDNN